MTSIWTFIAVWEIAEMVNRLNRLPVALGERQKRIYQACCSWALRAPADSCTSRALGAWQLLPHRGRLPVILHLPIALVFVAACGCGSPPTAEEQAVTHFKQLGGRVVSDEAGHAVQLYLAGTPVSDDDVTRIRDLPKLRHLELSSTSISDAALANFRDHPTLGSVDVAFTLVSQRGVRQLQKERPALKVNHSDRRRYQGRLDPISQK